jgi:hypothetical protein
MEPDFEDLWSEFGVQLGPLGFGVFGPRRFVTYSRTESTHALRVRLSSDVKKEEIKVRLVKPGTIEIEWPRRTKGEEIPVD